MTRSDLTQRAQRLIDEFEEGACMDPGAIDPGQSVRHGIAAVLTHIADVESEPIAWGNAEYVPVDFLYAMAEQLTAPTLLDRALAGDREAARQFLYEGGFTDATGELLPHLRTPEP